MDKDHGRIETRKLWCVPTDPKTLGLAGVAQVVRIHSHTQEVRRGKVIKETDDVRFAVTSYWPQEANPDRLQELGRGHWSIENGQHYRRDRTQDEDRCPVRETTTARNLSLFRSLAIFLFKRQSGAKTAKRPCPTLNVTSTANLGGSSAASPNAGMRSKPSRQSSHPGAAPHSAGAPALPRAPPFSSKEGCCSFTAGFLVPERTSC